MSLLAGDQAAPDGSCPTPPPMARLPLDLREPGFVPAPEHAPMCAAFALAAERIQPEFAKFETDEFVADGEAVRAAGERIAEAGRAIGELAGQATDDRVRADLEALATGFEAEGDRAAVGDISDRTARDLLRGFTRRYESQCFGLSGDARPMTRARVVLRLVGELDPPVAADDFFTDDDGSDAEDAFNRLASAGIVGGCGERTVCPDAQVTRGELAAYLATAFDLPPTDDDAFADDDGSRFEAAINRVAAAGLVAGRRGEGFAPDRPITPRDLDRFLSRARHLDDGGMRLRR